MWWRRLQLIKEVNFFLVVVPPITRNKGDDDDLVTDLMLNDALLQLLIVWSLSTVPPPLNDFCFVLDFNFDFVFNDLTDIPISNKDNKDLLLEDSAAMWEFVKEILELAIKLVKPNGKYLTHVRLAESPHSLENINILFFIISGNRIRMQNYIGQIRTIVERGNFHQSAILFTHCLCAFIPWRVGLLWSVENFKLICKAFFM
mgnify:CR=1 FL=1